MKFISFSVVVLLVAASVWPSVNAQCKPSCISCKTKGKCDPNMVAAGSSSGTAAGTGSGTAAGTGSGTAAGTGSGTAAGTGSGAAAGTGSGAAAGTGSGTAAGTGSGAAAGTGSGTAAGTGSGTAAGSGAASGLIPDGDCGDGEACTITDDGIPACRPVAETKCKCNGKTKGCDPFDLKQKIVCFGGQVTLSGTCSGTEECTGEAVCEAPNSGPPPTDLDQFCTGVPDFEFQVITPDCRSGILCNAGVKAAGPVNCTGTDYFDIQSGACAPYPPTNLCGCGKQKCPVIGDCSKYVLCNGNTFVDDETCVEAGKTKFDFDAQSCAAAAAGPCPKYENCKFTDTTTTTSPSTPSGGSPVTTSTSTTTSISTNTIPTPTTTTTTKPSTCNASNVNKRYPDENECKKYYTCRLVSRNTYDYVPSKCVGNLVFNPANGYCDLPENVPTCPK